jgi:predicted nucleic acid-binding Zn ribbon protein
MKKSLQVGRNLHMGNGESLNTQIPLKNCYICGKITHGWGRNRLGTMEISVCSKPCQESFDQERRDNARAARHVQD